MFRKPYLAAVVGIAVLTLVPGASAAVPAADLQLVSMTADVHHAKVGQLVTWTVVARNNGPDPADLNVLEDPQQFLGGAYPYTDFDLWRLTCDGTVSPDGWVCEYGLAQPGVMISTRAAVTVNASAPHVASITACVVSWGGPINDPNPTNDCLTRTLPIVGRRNHT
jgi:Domain of unknown function DUF11